MNDKMVMNRLDVIIPTYNRPDLLKRCLSSFTIQTFPKDDFKVIVINDGSEQDIEAIADEFKEKINILYLKKKRGGPATARNEGLKHAEAPIIAFTDDDCVPDKDWLSEIYEGFKKDPQALCVKGKTLALNPNDFAKACSSYFYRSEKSHATNNIAYKRSVFDVIGGFDERFVGAAYEDNDLKWRFLKEGYKRIYSEKMIVHHPAEDSIDAFRKNNQIQGAGLVIFFKKYILKRPVLAFAVLLYELRYLPIGWFFVLFRKNSYSKIALNAMRSVFILEGFLNSFFKKPEKYFRDFR